MPIYLKHDRHGTKVACSEAEAKYDESLGWERYTVGMRHEGEVPAPEPIPNQIGEAPVALLSEARTKRKYTRRA